MDFRLRNKLTLEKHLGWSLIVVVGLWVLLEDHDQISINLYYVQVLPVKFTGDKYLTPNNCHPPLVIKHNKSHTTKPQFPTP